MRRESPDELTRLVVTALAVFIGGTAALVASMVKSWGRWRGV